MFCNVGENVVFKVSSQNLPHPIALGILVGKGQKAIMQGRNLMNDLIVFRVCFTCVKTQMS